MRYRDDAPKRVITPVDGRVGVPRTLGFDELRVFFDTFFAQLGFHTVRSPRSGPEVLRAGSARCIDEVCFPLKTFFGHVELLRDQGISAVFVPRLISFAKGRNSCPKLHVLPDLIASAFPELEVLTAYIDFHHARRKTFPRHLLDACRPLARSLGKGWPADVSAFRAAWRAQLEEDSRAESPVRAARGGDVTIAVLGHPYAERDEFLGLSVPRHLRRLGAEVVFSPKRLDAAPVGGPLEEGLYYETSHRTARAVAHHVEGGVDGIVLMTFFACGPDSYAADTLMYRLERHGRGVPVMRLIIDEQTASEGLMTRLATFVDIARHRKGRRGAGGCR